VIGKQVSNVEEVGTGRDVGCTEALRLTDVRADAMVFQAVTGHPTDPSYHGVCPKGNVYVVTMTEDHTLLLGNEGAQAAGSPTTFTRAR
jgi:hypothetical protein